MRNMIIRFHALAARVSLLAAPAALAMIAALLRAQSPADRPTSLPNLFPLANPSGILETYNINNTSLDLTGAFFQSLGTNGRSCSSCHRPAEAWTVSAAEIQTRFLLTPRFGSDFPLQ